MTAGPRMRHRANGPIIRLCANDRHHASAAALHRQVRWWILALLFSVTVINFADRQALSVLAPTIRNTFHLSNTQCGTIVSWFQFGMVVGEFPMGWLMDRVGVRAGLTFAVLWWSFGNGLHAVAGSLWQFRLFRFWLGTGECGCHQVLIPATRTGA